MNYAYKITNKLKNEKEFFKKMFPIEDEETYVKMINFPTDSKIVQGLIGYLNNEQWQKRAGLFEPDGREALEEQGFKYEEITNEDGSKKYEIILSDELLTDLSAGYLMVEKKGEYKDYIYIGSATDSYPFVFFNTQVLDSNCAELIKAMKEEKYIVKVKISNKSKK